MLIKYLKVMWHKLNNYICHQINLLQKLWLINHQLLEDYVHGLLIL